jgi:hypothetical protein
VCGLLPVSTDSDGNDAGVRRDALEQLVDMIGLPVLKHCGQRAAHRIEYESCAQLDISARPVIDEGGDERTQERQREERDGARDHAVARRELRGMTRSRFQKRPA